MIPPPAALTRPLLRYLGSKWRLAPWILEHFPPHEIYVEPCGGAAAVLLQKPASRVEVYNDIDGDLVNLFAVLRSPDAGELIRQVALTPYASAEYRLAHLPAGEPIERARRLLVRSHMGYGTRGTRTDRAAGFRVDGNKGNTNVARNWADFPDALAAIVERLRTVTLCDRDAVDLVEYWNNPEALIFLDPPYVAETRSSKAKQAEGYHTYAHEMSHEDHRRLLAAACASRSMVAISGYASALYDDALQGWTCVETAARAHMNSERTELLWLNAHLVARLSALRVSQGHLFGAAA